LVQSDVWCLLTCIDDDGMQDRNTWNTIQDQNWIFFFLTMNNAEQKKKLNKE
jgi:hypothetical protein